MAEETKNTSETPLAAEVVVVSDVPEAETPEKEPKPEVAVAVVVVEADVEAEVVSKPGVDVEEAKIIDQTASFKEETNVVGDLPELQKKALDELKLLIQEALNNHDFTAPEPPPPPPTKEEEKPAVVVVEESSEPTKDVVVEDEPKVTEPLVEAVLVEETVAIVDEDGAKTVEAIEETIVVATETKAVTEAETTPPPPPPQAPEVEPVAPPPVPEEVFLWGIPLLKDELSDVILLKFLRARDFKAKEALTMIKNTVRWRKEFKIEEDQEEEEVSSFDKVVFTHGVDKEGHPVCYNVYGEFQDKDLYNNTFSDEEKRKKFLRWRIQFLEKSIRKLDFKPTGISTIVQITDLKNFPGPGKRELRQVTNQAVQLFQDNYPEFVAKQIFVNVPWWYLAYNRIISPFLTQRTKSKFVFAGPSKSADTLFKYIGPEHVPVQYGGLSGGGDQEFTVADSVTEVTIQPATKHAVEIPVSERSVVVWEVRVVGWEVSYGAEFVPGAEDGYTIIVQKTRKVGATDETVVANTFKIGESGKLVLNFDNQTSKKKKLLYRFKIKHTSD